MISRKKEAKIMDKGDGKPTSINRRVKYIIKLHCVIIQLILFRLLDWLVERTPCHMRSAVQNSNSRLCLVLLFISRSLKSIGYVLQKKLAKKTKNIYKYHML